MLLFSCLQYTYTYYTCIHTRAMYIAFTRRFTLVLRLSLMRATAQCYMVEEVKSETNRKGQSETNRKGQSDTNRCPVG
jgi:hypothetical protein